MWSSDQLNVKKYELDTIYDINDLFDFWEVLDAREELLEIQELEHKAEADRIKAQNQQTAGRR